jgi:hypothetical protein
MEIFEAFDLTGTAWSAARLAGCDAKTVVRYVAVREAGGDPLARTARPKMIDAFMPKVEELADRSKGKIRADVAHRKIAAMGYRGSERSARRAVAEVKEAWRAGRRRRCRPWIPEPGMWLQWDRGDGPVIGGRKTQLFSAWLAWSRFRVVIPARDQQLGTLTWCLDQALRRAGGAPAYLLTGNRAPWPWITWRGSRCGTRRWSRWVGITAARWRPACRPARSPKAGWRRR